MRRLARHPLVLYITAVALATVVATAAVWSRGGFIELDVGGGEFQVSWRLAPQPAPPGVPAPTSGVMLTDVRLLGVRYFAVQNFFTMRGQGSTVLTDTRRYVHVPLWELFLVAVAFPLILAIRAARERRRRARFRLCAACGYDLRASPGRCPECGASAFPEGAA